MCIAVWMTKIGRSEVSNLQKFGDVIEDEGDVECVVKSSSPSDEVLLVAI